MDTIGMLDPSWATCSSGDSALKQTVTPLSTLLVLTITMLASTFLQYLGETAVDFLGYELADADATCRGAGAQSGGGKQPPALCKVLGVVHDGGTRREGPAITR